jgi:glutamate formiminotransferase/glutamate formiminotransferase/formiminotetrahydrofolate cyclodeaminase
VPTLLTVPNISEGRDRTTIDAVASAFAPLPVLDIHTDPDHHRAVFTVGGAPGELAPAVTRAAAEAKTRIDLAAHAGIHPRVGALDVAPIVYLTEADRGAACAEALVLADCIAEQLELPVFLYGALAGGRTRAEIRRGGPDGLAARDDAGDQVPDFGPKRLDRHAGAVLVGARPPLVAFNVELASPATVQDAKAIAALIREGGAEGLPGVRAIGLWLEQTQVAQVSTNVEDHRRVPLAEVVKAVARHATPSEAELVGLAPAQAFDGFPADLQVRNRRLIEDALGTRH